MELKDTIKLMESNDYKDRFKAEYYQLKIRKEKLQKMVDNWESLNFKPTCSKNFYASQLDVMESYMLLLNYRAVREHIDLGNKI